MQVADKFTIVRDEKGHYASMWCAIWRMSPASQVYIGAPTLDDLERAWHEITCTSFDRDLAHRVHVYADIRTAESQNVSRDDG